MSDQNTTENGAIKDPAEGPLVAYLKAAAGSFPSNDWQPADEAWAKMTVKNSKWYVRVAPDETYVAEAAGGAGGAIVVGSTRTSHAEAGPPGRP